TKISLGMQTTRETHRRQCPVPHTLPPTQHLTRQRQQLLTNRRSRVIPIHHCLKISTQVRPTPLVPFLGQVAVYAVPVAAQHAPVVSAHQRPQGSAVAAADDLVHRGYRRHHPPQPTAVAPRRFIDRVRPPSGP